MGAIVDYCYESSRKQDGAEDRDGGLAFPMQQPPDELAKVQQANRVITYWQQQDELFDQLSFQYITNQINGHLMLHRYQCNEIWAVFKDLYQNQMHNQVLQQALGSTG